MAHVSASIDLPVSPDEIWQLIGLGAAPYRCPATISSAGFTWWL
jgi:hypothetical protein